MQQFFALPLEKKLKYEIPGLAGQRGYTSFGREHAKGSEAPDLKEFFQYGQTVGSNHPLKPEYPDNVVVAEIPELNETLFNAYRNFEKSGKALLQAIALCPSRDTLISQISLWGHSFLMRNTAAKTRPGTAAWLG